MIDYIYFLEEQEFKELELRKKELLEHPERGTLLKDLKDKRG